MQNRFPLSDRFIRIGQINRQRVARDLQIAEEASATEMIYQPCVTGITELRQQKLQYNRLRVYSPCVVELKNSNGACR
jgi:hypothetical protein